MTSDNIFRIKKEWLKNALVDKADYEKKYNDSINNNVSFWKKEGKRINWIKNYENIKDVKYSSDDVHIKWFYDGTLNASYNCIDRHVKTRGDQVAIIWEGDEPGNVRKITYKELLRSVCQIAEVLIGRYRR